MLWVLLYQRVQCGHMGGSKSVPSGTQGRKGFIEEMELELGTEVRGRKGVKREHSR